MRLFIALEIPPGFTDDIAALVRQLETAVEGRFLPRNTYHVTLAFLGETDEIGLAAAIEAMEVACEGVGPIPVRSDGLGKFGRAIDATLWLGLVVDPTLAGLVGRLREQLEMRGIAFDVKTFKPHVTLARRACIPKGALPALAFPQEDKATTVTLFKSVLSREGAAYKALHSIGLSSSDVHEPDCA